ncbi:MAG: MarR family winged helix-turn-helix transcriptional regulator [Leptospirillia bacterium]
MPTNDEIAADEIAALDAAPASEPPTYEVRILRSLRQIIRATAMYSRELQVKHHVTVPQLTCLAAVAENEPATTTRIAREVQLSPSTVVGIVDRLENAGLVRRKRDTGDRRVVNITLTEEGLRLVARSPSPLQAELARALESLPDLERATIALSLEKLVNLLHVGTLDAAPILETGETVAQAPETEQGESGAA